MHKLYLILMMVLLLLLTGCGGNKTQTASKNSDKNNDKKATATPTKAADTPVNTPSGVTPESLEAAIRQALGDGYVADMDTPADELPLTMLGGIDLSKIDSYVAKQNAVPSVHADTVIIVRCKDASYADTVVAAFNEFVDRAHKQAKIYPLEPFKQMEARLYKAGDIVMYILAGAPLPEDSRLDDMQQYQYAVDEYKKIDDALKSLLGYLPENLLSDGSEGGEDEGGEDNGAAFSNEVETIDGAFVPEE